jgi:hypothetical protein
MTIVPYQLYDAEEGSDIPLAQKPRPVDFTPDIGISSGNGFHSKMSSDGANNSLYVFFRP